MAESSEVSRGSSNRPEPGATWGDYEIISRLGQGGMAEVWLAHLRGAHGFKKKVVLKTITPDRAQSRTLLQMFVREASLAAQLHHPGLVQIRRLGEVQGCPFIEMEYIAGCTLREVSRKLVRGARQSSLIALRAVGEACEGLHFLHSYCDDAGRALGLVHRDLSPENMMIAFTGHTKLLDFGIISPTGVPHRTIVASVKGKYSYMAPEVLRGDRDTPQRDIYALGVILYEFATGHRPFRGKTEAELLFKIANERARPPHLANPHCPEPLSRLIMQAMHPDPTARPATAEELGRELRRLLRSMDDLEIESSDLGMEIASLFPDRPDIPAALRSKLSSVRSSSSGADSPLPSSSAPAVVLERSSVEATERALRPELTPDDALEHEEIELSSPDVEAVDDVPVVEPTPLSVPSEEARPVPSTAGTPGWLQANVERMAEVFSSTPRKRADPAVDVFSLSKSRRFDSAVTEAPSDPRQEAPLVDAQVEEAEACFERGLSRVREGLLEAALFEWERAAALDPLRRQYAVNVTRLRERIEKERSGT